MQEFNINDFANSIRAELYERFPYEDDAIKMSKHATRPAHIRDIALGLTFTSNDQAIFEIGNDYAEEYYPYYHILEDAEVIRKRGRGTKKSKGSQAQITKLSERDYARISFNGRTYSREYQKNVRGKRSMASKGTIRVVGADGVVYNINKNASYYTNKHYHYIERILDTILPWIAPAFGLRTGRVERTSLESDYEENNSYDLKSSIMAAMYSHEGEWLC